MNKIFGIIILLLVLLGVIVAINRHQSRVSWNQRLIEQQRDSISEEYREKRIAEMEVSINTNTPILLYVELFIMLILSLPGLYLLGTKKRSLIAVDWVLLTLTIINSLAFLFIKVTGDSLFPPYWFVVVPALIVYIISFMVLLSSVKEGKLNA